MREGLGMLSLWDDGQCLASPGWQEYSGEAARGTLGTEGSTRAQQIKHASWLHHLPSSLVCQGATGTKVRNAL